jgi:hypothetical protein
VTGKIQKILFYTFALSPSFAHRLQKSTRSQITLIHPWINLYSFSQKELLIHKPLSLITKTRIRGLDAFSWPQVVIFVINAGYIALRCRSRDIHYSFIKKTFLSQRARVYCIISGSLRSRITKRNYKLWEGIYPNNRLIWIPKLMQASSYE